MSTVSTSDAIKLLTIRATNFEKVPQGDSSGNYPVEEVGAQIDSSLGKVVEN